MRAGVANRVPSAAKCWRSAYVEGMNRSGFILLFGTRPIVSDDGAPAVRATCPNCQRQADIVGKSVRHWFTLFFIPLFPVSGRQRFSQCTTCGAQFPLGAEELWTRVAASEQEQSRRAIAMYNSLRASPANVVTLNELMTLYASMGEYDQAIGAAGEFPAALQSSEQCMTTLGRVYLAANRHAEALRWFDAALARNDQLAEAHHHKAVAHLTATPPDYNAAMASARAARSLGYAGSEELLREAEGRARG